jgi:hypothetical protein
LGSKSDTRTGNEVTGTSTDLFEKADNCAGMSFRNVSKKDPRKKIDALFDLPKVKLDE